MSAAGAATIAVFTKRVSAFLCIAILGGAVEALCFAMAVQTSLDLYLVASDPHFQKIYETTSYTVGISMGVLVGGGVLTGYYLLSVRPQSKYKRQDIA